MSEQFDFKKEWDKTKTQLIKFSKEAAKVAKKGEEELIKISKKSRLHIDSTALSLKKEKLYYLIGKEYVKNKDSEKMGAKMEHLLRELSDAEKEQKIISVKIKQVDKKNGVQDEDKKS